MPSASLVKEFENLIGKENVFTSEADRQSYAYDAAVLPSVPDSVFRRCCSCCPRSFPALSCAQPPPNSSAPSLSAATPTACP